MDVLNLQHGRGSELHPCCLPSTRLRSSTLLLLGVLPASGGKCCPQQETLRAPALPDRRWEPEGRTCPAGAGVHP